MNRPKFQFSNVVVVEGNLIGVVVKAWQTVSSGNSDYKEGSYHYEVYVRSCNAIIDYKEEDIKHFIYDKELSNEALEYYNIE